MNEIEKFEIHNVCDAYEKGYGHGYDARSLDNPYQKRSPQHVAWQYGDEVGKSKRQLKNNSTFEVLP